MKILKVIQDLPMTYGYGPLNFLFNQQTMDLVKREGFEALCEDDLQLEIPVRLRQTFALLQRTFCGLNYTALQMELGGIIDIEILEAIVSIAS